MRKLIILSYRQENLGFKPYLFEFKLFIFSRIQSCLKILVNLLINHAVLGSERMYMCVFVEKCFPVSQRLAWRFVSSQICKHGQQKGVFMEFARLFYAKQDNMVKYKAVSENMKIRFQCVIWRQWDKLCIGKYSALYPFNSIRKERKKKSKLLSRYPNRKFLRFSDYFLNQLLNTWKTWMHIIWFRNTIAILRDLSKLSVV